MASELVYNIYFSCINHNDQLNEEAKKKQIFCRAFQKHHTNIIIVLFSILVGSFFCECTIGF